MKLERTLIKSIAVYELLKTLYIQEIVIKQLFRRQRYNNFLK